MDRELKQLQKVRDRAYQEFRAARDVYEKADEAYFACLMRWARTNVKGKRTK